MNTKEHDTLKEVESLLEQAFMAPAPRNMALVARAYSLVQFLASKK